MPPPYSVSSVTCDRSTIDLNTGFILLSTHAFVVRIWEWFCRETLWSPIKTSCRFIADRFVERPLTLINQVSLMVAMLSVGEAIFFPVECTPVIGDRIYTSGHDYIHHGVLLHGTSAIFTRLYELRMHRIIVYGKTAF